jgi:hypothetical protein
MKAIHNDPARRLLLKLDKPVLIDVVLDLLRKGGVRAVTEQEAYDRIEAIVCLHDVTLPTPQVVAGCTNGRCCTPPRPTKRKGKKDTK